MRLIAIMNMPSCFGDPGISIGDRFTLSKSYSAGTMVMIYGLFPWLLRINMISLQERGEDVIYPEYAFIPLENVELEISMDEGLEQETILIEYSNGHYKRHW